MHDTLVILQSSSIVRKIEIIEDDPGDKVSLLKLRAMLIDSSIFSVSEIETTDKFKYSYNWLKPNGELIIRWDNAPHWKSLKTFPHHKHINKNTVLESHEVSVGDILPIIEEQMRKIKK